MELDKNYILYELEGKISELLRKEYLPEERPIESIFQIIYEPSFDEKVSFEVFKTLKDNNIDDYFLVKSVWDKAGDSSKLDMPLAALKIKYTKGLIEPTLKREKVKLEKSIVEYMLIKLSQVRVSPMPNNSVKGLDGTTYELRFNSLYNSCFIKWWEEGPRNWSKLTSVVINFLNYFLDMYK